MAIEITKGTAADLDRFADLLLEVRGSMDNKEWLYVDPREELREQMESGIMELWLAKDGQRIAGGFDILFPGLRPFNYGYLLDFSREELMRVVNMDSVAVHPDYRGQGLHRKFLETIESWVRGLGPRILLCTIHPDNIFSLNNALKMGYQIQKRLALYDSERYVLRKDI